MLFMGVLFTILLLDFSNPVPFLLFLLLLRASFPRIRIDHVISFNWGHIVPFLTGFLIILYPIILILY
jgi:NADH:ubiquinone oxidoreductase subunit H